MVDSTAVAGHGSEGCRCVISPTWLRQMRRRRMVSLQAISAASGYSYEYLAGVERAEPGKCTEPTVIHDYEQAMGVTAEAALVGITGEIVRSLWSAYETLTRLTRARGQAGAPAVATPAQKSATSQGRPAACGGSGGHS